MRLYNFLMLNEGGNALNGVSKINAANVNSTIAHIYRQVIPLLRISDKEVRLLGSAGKKSTPSGDLDIALSSQALILNNELKSVDDVYKFIEAKLRSISSEVRVFKGLGTVSFAWPIYNDDKLQENETVQVDFMLADSLDWMVFKNFSPSEIESKYKGVHRNILMAGIAKAASYKIKKKQGDTPVEWEKYTIAVDGLVNNVETNLGKNGSIKKTKTVLDRSLVTQDPIKATEIFLGPGHKVSDMNSFESIYKIIMSPNFIWKDSRDKILTDTAKGIHSLGLPLPKELENYL